MHLLFTLNYLLSYKIPSTYILMFPRDVFEGGDIFRLMPFLEFWMVPPQSFMHQ